MGLLPSNGQRRKSGVKESVLLFSRGLAESMPERCEGGWHFERVVIPKLWEKTSWQLHGRGGLIDSAEASCLHAQPF